MRMAGRVVKGGALLLAVGGAGSLVLAASQQRKKYLTLPEEFYLDLDLRKVTLVERGQSSPFQALFGGASQVMETCQLAGLLRDAGVDPIVKGVFASLGPRCNLPGLAQASRKPCPFPCRPSCRVLLAQRVP